MAPDSILPCQTVGAFLPCAGVAQVQHSAVPVPGTLASTPRTDSAAAPKFFTHAKATHRSSLRRAIAKAHVDGAAALPRVVSTASTGTAASTGSASEEEVIAELNAVAAPQPAPYFSTFIMMPRAPYADTKLFGVSLTVYERVYVKPNTPRARGGGGGAAAASVGGSSRRSSGIHGAAHRRPSTKRQASAMSLALHELGAIPVEEEDEDWHDGDSGGDSDGEGARGGVRRARHMGDLGEDADSDEALTMAAAALGVAVWAPRVLTILSRFGFVRQFQRALWSLYVAAVGYCRGVCHAV